MAEILPFKGSQRSIDHRSAKRKGAAEVIIFPGVRIDRDKFSLADRLKPSSLLRSNAKLTQPKRRD